MAKSAKSAFEKWYNKHGIAFNLNNIAAELAWLAALRWALSKCQATKLAGDYYLTRVISEETIEAEIKKIKGS